MDKGINDKKIHDLLLTGVYSDSFNLDSVSFRAFLDPSFYDDPNIYEMLRNTNIKSNYIFHDHMYYEILFILEGSISFETKDKKITAERDSIIFIPKNKLHMSVFNDDCKYYSMGFVIDKNKIDNVDERLYKKFVKLFDSKDFLFFTDHYMIEMAKQLSENIKYNYFFSRYIINSLFREIILNIVKNIIVNSNEKIKNSKGILRPNFFYVINQKLNSLDDNKLKDIANELYFSERQLSRIIKKQFGVSYMERKNIIRVESAKRLLANKELSLEKIAEMVSFSSVSSFINIFKDLEDMTPSQYRKKMFCDK